MRLIQTYSGLLFMKLYQNLALNKDIHDENINLRTILCKYAIIFQEKSIRFVVT